MVGRTEGCRCRLWWWTVERGKLCAESYTSQAGALKAYLTVTGSFGRSNTRDRCKSIIYTNRRDARCTRHFSAIESRISTYDSGGLISGRRDGIVRFGLFDGGRRACRGSQKLPEELGWTREGQFSII